MWPGAEAPPEGADGHGAGIEPATPVPLELSSRDAFHNRRPHVPETRVSGHTMSGRDRTRARRRALLVGMAPLALTPVLVAGGCGGSDGSASPDPQPPATTPAPSPQPPPGFPRDVASGKLAGGGTWTLSETGLGEVCLRLRGEGTGRSGCTKLTATWLVGTLHVPRADGPGQIVYAALPCGVSKAELRRGGTLLDSEPTVAVDDVTYAALEGPAALDGVELVGIGHLGTELFRADRLEDDASPRVPTPGC